MVSDPPCPTPKRPSGQGNGMWTPISIPSEMISENPPQAASYHGISPRIGQWGMNMIQDDGCYIPFRVHEDIGSLVDLIGGRPQYGGRITFENGMVEIE